MNQSEENLIYASGVLGEALVAFIQEDFPPKKAKHILSTVWALMREAAQSERRRIEEGLASGDMIVCDCCHKLTAVSASTCGTCEDCI